MWRFLLSLRRIRKARRAAVAMIVPLVAASRRRLGGIGAATWSDPYVIGFMAMLITLVSRVEVGRLDDSALGLVQTGAWQDITGLSGDALGEDMLQLGAAHDHGFETGCRNAVTFGSMLVTRSLLFAGAARMWQDAADPNRTPPAARDDISGAWEQFFDAHATGRAISAADTGSDQATRWT